MTKLGTGIHRSEDGGETWRFMNRYNNRPGRARPGPPVKPRLYSAV